MKNLKKELYTDVLDNAYRTIGNNISLDVWYTVKRDSWNNITGNIYISIRSSIRNVMEILNKGCVSTSGTTLDF